MPCARIYLDLVSIVAVLLTGCAGTYKNPENSNTQAVFKAHDSLTKSSYRIVRQDWSIYSDEKCSNEPGYGKIGALIIFGSNHEPLFFPLPKRFIEEESIEEMSVSLKPDERSHILAVSSIQNISSSITCSNHISFIPYKDTEYIIQQYFSVNTTNNQQYCGIKVIDKNINMEPISLLVHKSPSSCIKFGL